MSSQTVLVVAPEEPTLLPLTLAIRRENCRTLTAINPEEASVILGRERIALLIVDDDASDGEQAVDFLSMVRARWPDTVRVLMTTGRHINALTGAVTRAHVFSFLLKPWLPENLRSLVRDSIRFHEMLCDNRRLYELTVAQSLQLRQLNDDLERKVSERTAEIERKGAELEDNFVDIIRLLTNVLEVRSSTMAGQSHYMADAARWLAKTLYLTPEEQRNVEIAALLHNLGQLGLPDKVIQTSSLQLEQKDKELLRHSALVAESLLATIPRLKWVSRIVRHQGEWWNGQGFPDGLVGEAIPMGSRIITVIAGYLKYQDWASMQHYAGKRYDPHLLREFRRYLDERPRMRVAQAKSELKLHVSQLNEGMVLARDLVMPTGQVLASSGHVVDRLTLERIQQAGSGEASEGKVYVQI
jgi:response regulator RpfG family c-di-GMP phosphodiesterase